MREFVACWRFLLIVVLFGTIYFRILEGHFDWVLVILSVAMVIIEILNIYIDIKD